MNVGLVQSAPPITTVSSPLSDQIRAELHRTVPTIPNGVDSLDNIALGECQPLSQARVTIAHTGAEFYEGKRSPQQLFEAAKELGLTSQDICFYFIGVQGQPAEKFIERMADQTGVSDLIRLSPPVARDQCMHLQSRADALLLLLWDHPAEKAVITGKLFEYIAVRRPVVVVGCPEKLAALVVRDHHLGYVVADTETAKTTLRNLLDSKTAHSGLLPDVESDAVSEFGRSAYITRWISAIADLPSGRCRS